MRMRIPYTHIIFDSSYSTVVEYNENQLYKSKTQKCTQYSIFEYYTIL